MNWHTSPPPVGVLLEFETNSGTMMVGALSYINGYRGFEYQVRRQYMLKGSRSGVFEVTRWRRVATS